MCICTKKKKKNSKETIRMGFRIMARSKKCRRICLDVACSTFQALGREEKTLLELDELEAMRLADYENMEQEKAADKMNVSRGTFQRILYSARRKVADALLNGRSIHIESRERERTCCTTGPVCSRCYFPRRAAGTETHIRKENCMKIAVTCENDQVYQHFGHTPEFAVFEIVDGKINGMQKVPTGDSGHGALAGFLADRNVELLLCGGIGGGALQALAEAGIEVIGGVSGDVVNAVGDYLKGVLKPDPNFRCSHHHHEGGEEGHSCHCHSRE